MPNYEATSNAASGAASAGRQDWSGEVTAPAANAGWPQPWTAADTRFGGLQMQNNLPTEVIESPTTLNEAYLGSLKATLLRNRGNFIVATFLIGTQNTVSWEGILYEVGNDYVTIYQPGRDRYVVSDMYSLRYMEFYDTRRRQMCDELLAQRGMGGSMSSMGSNMGTMSGMNSNQTVAPSNRGW